MGYAYIERNYEVSEDGSIIFIYQWIGRNRLAEVGLGEAIRETGEFQQEFRVGGFLLRVVDRDFGHRLIVTRDPRWLVPIYRSIHRVGKSLEIAWHCFIYILCIWNLADRHPAEIPTWRDVKVAKWFAEKWGL